MAGLDDLFAQIPVAGIAAKLGADQDEVNNAIRTLVPALVGGLQANVAADDIDSTDRAGLYRQAVRRQQLDAAAVHAVRWWTR
ncbi:MAG: DUF937 domain-containing protein [Microbacteriaceae bacterium]